MDSCPCCDVESIPSWRKLLGGRFERFRCPACRTWLVYCQPQEPRLPRQANRLTFAVTLIILPVVLAAGVVAFALAASRIPVWLLLCVLGSFLSYGLWIAYVRYKQSMLVVAEYQHGSSALDFFRSFRELWRAPGGKRALFISVLLLAEWMLLLWLVTRLIGWWANSA